MTHSLAFFHDVCVSFSRKRCGTKIQSLMIPLSIPEKMNIKIKIQLPFLGLPPDITRPLIRKSEFAPATKEIRLLLKRGCFIFFF